MLAVVLFAQYGKAGGMGTLIGLIIMIGLILNGRCPLGSAPLERTDQQHQPDQLHQFAILPYLAVERRALSVIVFVHHSKKDKKS